MKSVDEWGQVYLDELGRVMELNDPDVHPGHEALTKVVEGVRREAAAEMKELCLGMLAEFAEPQAQYIKLDQIVRSLPLPGEEGYDKVYAEWIYSESIPEK